MPALPSGNHNQITTDDEWQSAIQHGFRETYKTKCPL